MLNAAFAVRTFTEKNPTAIDKALLVKDGINDRIYLWTNVDPIITVKRWLKLFGKQFQIRACLSSEVAPHLNQMYDEASSPLPIESVRRCKAK